MPSSSDLLTKQYLQFLRELCSLVQKIAVGGRSLEADKLIHVLNAAVEELYLTGEQLTAEAADLLALQRNHYHKLFETASIGYLVTTLSGIITDSNPAADALLAMLHRDLIGKPLLAFTPRETLRAFVQRLIGFRKASAAHHTWEQQLHRRGGTKFHALITVQSMYDDEQQESRLHWLIHDVSDRRALEEQRKLLLQRLVDAHEAERARIARELHDEMAQHVTALIMGLQAAKISAQAESALGQDIQKLQQLAEELAQAVHRISSQLRPLVLDDLGLRPAISAYIDSWNSRTSVCSSFHCGDLDEHNHPLPDTAKLAVYRIVQQALTNVMVHARAKNVSVVIERKKNSLHAIIEDDGQGFDLERAYNGHNGTQPLGLIGMRERATLMGGTFDIESVSGKGTTVFVRIPIAENNGRERLKYEPTSHLSSR